MKKSLKQSIQTKLESISLNEEQLDKLTKMQHDMDETVAVVNAVEASPPPASRQPFFIATSALLVLLLSAITLFNYFPNKTNSSLIQQIANEVATNHLKMKPMEVQSGKISDLQDYFTKLDFLPQQSQWIANNQQIQLAGGRYCSIQSATAAQLRYKNKAGDYVTIFETPYNPETFKQIPDINKGESPITTYAKGIKVTLWVERGLLMVSTEKP